MQKEVYRTYFDIPTETKVIFESGLYDVYSFSYKGEYSYAPIIKKNNETYVPISILQLMNKETKLLGDDNLFVDEDYTYIQSSNNLIIENKNKEVIYKEQIETLTINQYGGPLRYIEIDKICNWLNLSYEYDEKENVYFFFDIKGEK